ncbi:MAG: hypothetical protein RIS94_3235 [Pseudomonadota bacterium]|jgi:isopenicillin N synthase-like dioxygenase
MTDFVEQLDGLDATTDSAENVLYAFARETTVSSLAECGVDALPILDISLMQGNEDERGRFIAQMRDVLHKHGFFYLAGHGVPAKLTTEVMAASKRFFALPEADKLEIEMIRSRQFRGYNRAGMELTRGRQDWREQVDFDCEEDALEMGTDDPVWKRVLGPNLWPSAMPDLKATILRYQAECTRVGREVLEAIALALGQEQDFFAPMYEAGPRQHMKILRYPGQEGAQSDQGVGAHKDGGLVTILLQDILAGLRVQTEDGNWIEAPPIPGTFIVNTGELLELATNGFVHADVHGVVAPPPGTERFSIAFFFGASHDGSVPLIALPEELKKAERGVSTDPNNPLFRDIGLNHLKARLRSHPDVAQEHYADVMDDILGKA